MSIFANLQFPDRAAVSPDYAGPCIAAIYGFASREHMHRHLLRFLRESGYPDTTMYGHRQGDLIANDLQNAAKQGRPVVLIGFSQGGFEAMGVARELERRGVPVALLVPIAARGRGGRMWLHRWNFDMRNVPPNVELCLNYFSESDHLGTDPRLKDNLAVAMQPTSRVENIVFARSDGISHLGISRCYPSAKLHPKLKTQLLDRLLSELKLTGL
ncbi:thioesterase domain-containing protein [Marinobacter sp. S6332]|uniref:thioesterase domain-containing protein n=1 Tax=Marinobacter sp. S6332 TaxID=2926403 RepID=UPI001FF17D59|nr:thioesterase domain-containing protein [Marinobacter sp. S6332]MCK0163017.1 thioesterase domain-containing protein [Marinobacter sp. S6332]